MNIEREFMIFMKFYCSENENNIYILDEQIINHNLINLIIMKINIENYVIKIPNKNGTMLPITNFNDIKKILEPLIVPPSIDDDPDFYLDYGSDTSYHTKTGKGECAA